MQIAQPPPHRRRSSGRLVLSLLLLGTVAGGALACAHCKCGDMAGVHEVTIQLESFKVEPPVAQAAEGTSVVFQSNVDSDQVVKFVGRCPFVEDCSFTVPGKKSVRRIVAAVRREAYPYKVEPKLPGLGDPINGTLEITPRS